MINKISLINCCHFYLNKSYNSKICVLAIIGGGIGGAATSQFLTEIFNNNLNIDLYEAKTIGGRLATVKIDNNEFEAGGSIIHPRNKYMQDFVQLLGTSFFILLFINTILQISKLRVC